MTRPFEKAQPGEPFTPSASMHNATIDLINKFSLDEFSSVPAEFQTLRPDCWIKNTESTKCPRFAPIGIGDDEVFITPPAVGWIETPVLKGIFPFGGQVAIALEPIPPTKIGRAKLMGLVPATISVSDANLQKAKPVIGDFAFESSEDGFPILWKQGGTGTKFGYVLIGSGSSNEATSACPNYLQDLDVIIAEDAEWVLGGRTVGGKKCLVWLETQLIDCNQFTSLEPSVEPP